MSLKTDMFLYNFDDVKANILDVLGMLKLSKALEIEQISSKQTLQSDG